MTEELSLLAVLAHPDDESMGLGGILAKYSNEGARTGLITATGGEAGLAAGLHPVSGEELAVIRIEELRCACRLLGVGSLHLLGYRDGQLDRADPGQAEEGIVRVIRAVRPLVMVTFGPEGGGNRHPDHRAISRFATAAFHAAADPNRFPQHLTEGLQPHKVRKLYYLTRPPLTGDDPDNLGSAPVTTQVNIAEEVEMKKSAFRCHRTQVGDHPKLLKHLDQHGLWEYFNLAATRDLIAKLPEEDLFTGLR